MNHTQILIRKIQYIVLSFFLILFMLLSLNIVLPLKWQFPAWRLSPHLEKRTESTQDGCRFDYINSFGTITVALDKNYSTVLKTLNQDGKCTLERYYDNYGKPAVLPAGYSALRREYNTDGRWILQSYMNANLTPFTLHSGYSSIRRTYNSTGKVESEMYFNADGLPAMDANKRYGYRNEYDAEGHVTTITCLDSVGNAMNNAEHYAISKRTYYSNGKLRTEMFYDQDGSPAQLSSGQYGYLYVNGNPICLDKDGRKMFVLRHFLFHSIFTVLLAGIVLLILIMLLDRGHTCLLLLFYLVFIAYMTIINRELDSTIVTWHIPPNYYLFFKNREILANIWLFVPAGAMLYKLSHLWEISAVPIFMSLVIETTQLLFNIGAFELSDLIANSLGGIAGIMICYLLEPIVRILWKNLLSRFTCKTE